MKKLALGLTIAAFSSGVFAQAETVGGAATSTMLVRAGVVAVGAVAAGAKADSTSNLK